MEPQGLLELLATLPAFDAQADWRSISPGQARQFGAQKGSGIGGFFGAGIGALLAPITGGASMAVGGQIGKALGGLIGGNKAYNKAEDIWSERMGRQMGFQSMYRDLASQERTRQAQAGAMANIEESLKLNLL